MQDFKHIKAWQRAHGLAVELQKKARGFSRAGHGHLRAQLTRAAEGIGEGIVGGCEAASKREFSRLLASAISAANQTESHLLSAGALELISADDCDKYCAEVTETRKMIFGYRRRVIQSNRDANSGAD